LDTQAFFDLLKQPYPTPQAGVVGRLEGEQLIGKVSGPDTAMRELIANALIHQDLTLSGMRPTIEIYSIRVEISNPGDPLVAVERFTDSYRSRGQAVSFIVQLILNGPEEALRRPSCTSVLSNQWMRTPRLAMLRESCRRRP
jgi:hypothetical protein